MTVDLTNMATSVTVLVVLAVLVVLCTLSPVSGSKVLIVMLDGFRYDYIDRFPRSKLPGFYSFIDGGVKAGYLEPVFPATSPSNWMSALTGVYSEDHGIVNLDIYDAKTKKEFHYNSKQSDEDPYWWKDTRPVWASAVRQGKKVALIQWLTCLDSEGVSPQYCERFTNRLEDSIVCSDWIENGINLMTQNDTDFVWVHCDQPDDDGHAFGTDSIVTDDMILGFDDTLTNLNKKLDEAGIYDETDVIIISDHGMKNNDAQSSIAVDPYIDGDNIEKIQGEVAYYSFLAKEGQKEELWANFQNIPEGVRVWRKEDTPYRYHYKNHSFIHDFLMVADANHSINLGSLNDLVVRRHLSATTTPNRWRRDVLNYSPNVPPLLSSSLSFQGNSGGSHGYDDTDGQEPSMRGIFFAKGPDFKVGYQHPYLEMVDCYPIICHCLGIEEEPNKANWDRAKDIFK